jgi:YegS/Rv2252/BmrU family lipid kinase
MSNDCDAAERAVPPDSGSVTTGTIVLNPVAGSGEHAPRVHELAERAGYDVHETEGAGDATDLAARAAPETDLLVACGGDGTIQEVLRGASRANALDDVTLGVLPAGTGNNFAGNIGVGSIEEGFDVLTDGEARRVDVGVATAETPGESDRSLPFVNSCVGGLTAEASASTDPDEKSRIGVLAYVVNTFQEAIEFDGIRMEVQTSDGIEQQWDGTTTCILVGNGRRFLGDGRTQADMEDGLLEVTIFEGEGALDLAGSATIERLLDDSAADVVRLDTPALEATVAGEEPATFSLDGEMLTARTLTVETDHQALWLRVGEAYEPDPEPGDESPWWTDG